ncbi:MAG: class I SAM-dependent methyltransferase [Acidobacteriaceae bacterium]
MDQLKSNVEWKEWGKHDPLWGVSSWAGKEKGGASPWTDEEFYALGESEWQDFRAHWVKYGLQGRRCLEVGCGAGRLTRPLAGSFDSVFAVDVSEDMIRKAQSATSGLNVNFAAIDGMHLPQADSSVDAVFSTHVLQHLDNETIGLSYFQEFYRVLAPGGTLMVHIPLYQLPRGYGMVGKILKSELAAYHALAYFKANLSRRMGARIMRMTRYSIPSVRAALTNLAFREIEFWEFNVRSNNDPHTFVFATR